MKVNNPRHPHKCTVYRIIGEDSFSDGEKVILYEGICRKEGSTNLRTFKTDNVIKSDYLLSLPGIVEGILAGDLIDVTDKALSLNVWLLIAMPEIWEQLCISILQKINAWITGAMKYCLMKE